MLQADLEKQQDYPLQLGDGGYQHHDQAQVFEQGNLPWHAVMPSFSEKLSRKGYDPTFQKQKAFQVEQLGLLPHEENKRTYFKANRVMQGHSL